MAEAEHGGDGLLDTGRRIASSVLGLLQNRLSLAAVELQEEKLRIVSLLIWVGVALVLAASGIMVAIAALALFLWERAGYAGLIGLSVVTLGAGLLVVWLLRRRILQGPRPFAVTVDEFHKDLECLRSEP